MERPSSQYTLRYDRAFCGQDEDTGMFTDWGQDKGCSTVRGSLGGVGAEGAGI